MSHNHGYPRRNPSQAPIAFHGGRSGWERGRARAVGLLSAAPPVTWLLLAQSSAVGVFFLQPQSKVLDRRGAVERVSEQNRCVNHRAVDRAKSCRSMWHARNEEKPTLSPQKGLLAAAVGRAFPVNGAKQRYEAPS